MLSLSLTKTHYAYVLIFCTSILRIRIKWIRIRKENMETSDPDPRTKLLQPQSIGMETLDLPLLYCKGKNNGFLL